MIIDKIDSLIQEWVKDKSFKDKISMSIVRQDGVRVYPVSNLQDTSDSVLLTGAWQAITSLSNTSKKESNAFLSYFDGESTLVIYSFELGSKAYLLTCRFKDYNKPAYIKYEMKKLVLLLENSGDLTHQEGTDESSIFHNLSDTEVSAVFDRIRI